MRIKTRVKRPRRYFDHVKKGSLDYFQLTGTLLEEPGTAMAIHWRVYYMVNGLARSVDLRSTSYYSILSIGIE